MPASSSRRRSAVEDRDESFRLILLTGATGDTGCPGRRIGTAPPGTRGKQSRLERLARHGRPVVSASAKPIVAAMIEANRTGTAKRISMTVDPSEANARQVVSRARQHLASNRRMVASATERRRLLDRFFAAVQRGDFAGLEGFLASDVISAPTRAAAARCLSRNGTLSALARNAPRDKGRRLPRRPVSDRARLASLVTQRSEARSNLF